jgi:predicted transposase YdaD
MDEDNAWKDLLKSHFEDLLSFFFPEVHREIDWAKGFEFLDRELEMIAPANETGPRRVDKLARVFPREGGEVWILVHVEVQGTREAGFNERMHVYNYRIYDRFRRDVVSLVVLTDDHPGWMPGRYARGWRWCRTVFTFPVAKLERYRESEEVLERSENPFALVVLAHLRARKARTDQERLVTKTSLMRIFLERGLARNDIIALLRFLEWILTLPAELEIDFWRELKVQRQERNMPFLASFEREAMAQGKKEGLEEGLKEGLREGLELALNLRFGLPGLKLLPRIREVQDLERLRELKRILLEAGSLEEFERSIPKGSDSSASAARPA